MNETWMKTHLSQVTILKYPSCPVGENAAELAVLIFSLQSVAQ